MARGTKKNSTPETWCQELKCERSIGEIMEIQLVGT